MLFVQYGFLIRVYVFLAKYRNENVEKHKKKVEDIKFNKLSQNYSMLLFFSICCQTNRFNDNILIFNLNIQFKIVYYGS